jgi:2-polyprenyl-3-methyl-5-hydroxy-6-metoxy-1,4-benzoquinol methylase
MEHHPTDVVGRYLNRIVAQHPGADVVDIGGGSGTRAVPLAKAGCRVVVIDASTDALASLARRATEAGVGERITALQADADQLDAVLPRASADLVLYHQVVQDVDDPDRSVAAAAALLRPGGYLSVLVPGRLSAALAAALAGRAAEALSIMAADPAVDRRYDAPSLRSLMEQAGVVVETITGVGVVSALVASRSRAEDSVADLEWALGRHPILGQIGGDLHALGLAPAR